MKNVAYESLFNCRLESLMFIGTAVRYIASLQPIRTQPFEGPCGKIFQRNLAGWLIPNSSLLITNYYETSHQLTGRHDFRSVHERGIFSVINHYTKDTTIGLSTEVYLVDSLLLSYYRAFISINIYGDYAEPLGQPFCIQKSGMEGLLPHRFLYFQKSRKSYFT